LIAITKVDPQVEQDDAHSDDSDNWALPASGASIINGIRKVTGKQKEISRTQVSTTSISGSF